MKYQFLIIVIFMMFPVVNSAFVTAAQGQTAIPMADTAEITGRIENIDYDSSMIKLKVYSDEEETAYKYYEIYVGEDAKIEQNGKPITLRDLSSGERISVQFIIAKNGEREATYISAKEE